MSIQIPTVFVVDDEQQTRRSLVALISSTGLPVESFASGEEFLQGLEKTRPGCAVVDFRLGGMNGGELHRQLVAAECHLPVILISGYLDVRTTSLALEEGVFRVLEKPYRGDELTHTVEKALRHDCTTRKQKSYRLDFAHRLESLDARERVTLELVIAGHSNRGIERRLRVSTRTVDRIRSSILEKMQFQSFMELSAAFGAACAEDSPGLFPTSPAADHPAGFPQSAEAGFPSQRPSAADVNPELQWLCCDLHDGVAQYLAAALLEVEAVEAGGNISDWARSELCRTRKLLSLAHTDVRDIIAGHSPGLPHRAGLLPALQDWVDQLARPRGIQVEFLENLGDEPLPALQEMAAYRILQECLTNAVRHSGSQRIAVKLSRESGTLRLEVHDWGCGFDRNSITADHHGLRTIRQRAELLGGRASIQSEPGRGSLVTAELPLRTP